MATKKQEVEKVEEVKKVRVDNHSYSVKIKGGVLLQTNLTHEQAVQKVEALEKQDKILKAKNWTPGFYQIIKD